MGSTSPKTHSAVISVRESSKEHFPGYSVSGSEFQPEWKKCLPPQLRELLVREWRKGEFPRKESHDSNSTRYCEKLEQQGRNGFHPGRSGKAF